MLSGEAANINLIVYGLTRPALEPTIYCTRGEHANHYATDTVTTIQLLCNILYMYVVFIRMYMYITLEFEGICSSRKIKAASCKHFNICHQEMQWQKWQDKHQ